MRKLWGLLMACVACLYCSAAMAQTNSVTAPDVTGSQDTVSSIINWALPIGVAVTVTGVMLFWLSRGGRGRAK